MALNQVDIDTIIALWKYSEQQADPRSKEENIASGLRETPLVACQYWIKGLSPICSYWSDNACSYTGDQNPSGYNSGNCDYLGRQFNCDKYKASTSENLEEYNCVLPNIFISGIGKVSGDMTTGIIMTAVPKADIRGYCDGKCDGAGRGTGCTGTPGVSPIVCNYYRPWQMGFGALEPRSLERTIKADGSVYVSPEALQEAYEAVDVAMKKRVPLAFVIYNLRAQFQKCSYWDNDYGSYFYIDSYGYVYSDEDLESKCTCTDIDVEPYHTLKNPTGGGPQDWILQDVWSQANTVICNGAKPECPKYTGKWKYCNDKYMYMGALVTASQVFELRFYANDWANQEEYESIFKERPNWQDVATADIQTFRKWLRIGPTASDSIAEGQIIHMNVCAGVSSGGEEGKSFDKVFDPNTVLTKTPIQYTAVGIDAGTTAPLDGQVYFPSLIRDFDKSFSDDRLGGNRLTIIYPYSYTDPWSEESRPEDSPIYCYKYGSAIPNDTVSVVGYTVRNREVYAFNADMISDKCTPPSELFTHDSVATISTIKTVDDEDDKNLVGLSPREKFMVKLKAFIYKATRYDPDNIISEDSSNYGDFKLGPLKLKYNQMNKIVICVAFGDDDWDFRIRPVFSHWCGGFLVQTSFTQEGTGEGVPSNFNPPAKITARTYPLSTIENGANLADIVHVDSNEWVDESFNNHYTYSYCYKKYTSKGYSSISQWKSIGPGGMVWGEIQDVNINYLFEWGITRARMFYKPSDGSPFEVYIEMENISIETFISGNRSVPPAAFILKIKSGNDLPDEYVHFYHDEWRLEVAYWYTKISDDLSLINEPEKDFEVSFPNFDDTNISAVESTLDILFFFDEVIIENVNDQTVSLMALFNAPDGRIVASMATKLLVQVVMVECRNVEIDYRYTQPTQWYKLLPETSTSNLATPPVSDAPQGEYSPRYYRPPCGDHSNGDQCSSIVKKPGPMWYPFISCDSSDFYRCYAGAAFCTNYFLNTPRDDMRFCGPTKYTAWVDGGGAGAYADCVLPFHYRYSVTTAEATFAGRANIVAYVNILEYMLYCWSLPPFGNKGREMVTKWISQDRWAYLSYKNTFRPSVKNQWVPLVPDLPDFFMTFNAFEQPSVTNLNNFTHVNQLTFFTCSSLNDEVDYDRKRFEDVFGYRGIWRASYPPKIVYQGLLTHTLHYYFKDPEVTWVWRELWKDTEGGDFVFVSYDRPEYKYDWKKLEHRYICEEGTHTIYYTAPVVNDEAKLTKWPSLSLDSGPPRFFKCLYDGTYEGDAEWVDDGCGAVDGSVSTSDDPDKPKNIYEETSPTTGDSKWNHDPNILFDRDAVRDYEVAEAAGRKYEISDNEGGFIDYYYNRGLISNLRKESLQYMPYEERDYEFFPGDVTGSPWIGKWFNTGPGFIYDISELHLTPKVSTDPPIKVCVSEVQIKGEWGFCGVGCNVCLPGVVIEEYKENSPETPTRVLINKPAISYEADVYENEEGGMTGVIRDFILTFELQPTPERIYRDSGFKLRILFKCSNQQWIYLDSIIFKVANYVDNSTTIDTYERKYISSKSDNLGDHNIDGPKVGDNFVLQTDLDGDYAGTYYAINPEARYVPDSKITARDKMRAIYASEQHRFDEALDINIGNIETIEQTDQQNLYNAAINYDEDGDVVTYAFILPPVYEKFFKDIGFFVNISSTNLVFKTVKPGWEDNFWFGLYTPGEGIWYPQGHRFIWSGDMRRMFCYENDYMPEYDPSGYGRFDIMEVDFLHMDSLEIQIPTDPLTALYANRMAYQISVAEKLFGNDSGFVDAGNLMGSASSFIDDNNVADSGRIT